MYKKQYIQRSHLYHIVVQSMTFSFLCVAIVLAITGVLAITYQALIKFHKDATQLIPTCVHSHVGLRLNVNCRNSSTIV